MKNTAGLPRGRARSPEEDTGNTKKESPLFVGLPKINYLCIVMYKQLYLGAKVASFCLTPKKKSKKEIAHIVDISQSTLSRELKRNGSPSGKYVWFKAHDKAMER